MRIGVLALQGGYREHSIALERQGARAVAVRVPSELAGLDGLVIPGGESTTISLLADRTELRQPIVELIAQGMPMLGTCAGMIMLADRVAGGRADRPSFGGIDMTVQRNAFGRQRDSFEQEVHIAALGAGAFPGVFIRAPQVTQIGSDVIVLGSVSFPNAPGRIVAVRQGSLMATAFHPELVDDGRIHGYFLRLVKGEEAE